MGAAVDVYENVTRHGTERGAENHVRPYFSEILMETRAWRGVSTAVLGDIVPRSVLTKRKVPGLASLAREACVEGGDSESGRYEFKMSMGH